MKNILLVYPPFCTPASPPYSLANLYAFLKKNLDDKYAVDVLDLNVLFHKLKFPKFQEYYKSINKDMDFEEYNSKTKEFQGLTKDVYAKNNKLVVNGENPELFKELVDKIKEMKPDIVAISVVYSSQVFYTYSIIKELKKHGIKTVIGGPAVNPKIIDACDAHLKNEMELIGFINGKKHDELDFDYYPLYDKFKLDDYFVGSPVIPIRTCTSCYYKKCAFCSHHQNSLYFEFTLDRIKDSIVNSGKKHIFIVDDMIHKKRLLEIADALKPLNVFWQCQLKPTIDLDYKTLKILHDSGLRIVVWGVESACDRVLGLIEKGTNSKDIEKVLEGSKKAGIKNGVYIMAGFPGETKEEFIETIDFLKTNSANIDLVSVSIFGLQKGTPIYNNPEKFGIKIIEQKRTILEPKISYTLKSGLTQEEASGMKKKYKKTLEKLNKYPKEMNFFREHMLSLEE